MFRQRFHLAQLHTTGLVVLTIRRFIMTKKAKSKTKKQAKKSVKPQPKRTKKPAKVASSKFPRHPRNPYRPSAYSHIFDVLSAHKNGMRRDELVRIVAKETGDLKHSLYNIAVVLSPTQDGTMHKSAKGQTYFVRKTADHIQLFFR